MLKNNEIALQECFVQLHVVIFLVAATCTAPSMRFPEYFCKVFQTRIGKEDILQSKDCVLVHEVLNHEFSPSYKDGQHIYIVPGPPKRRTFNSVEKSITRFDFSHTVQPLYIVDYQQ